MSLDRIVKRNKAKKAYKEFNKGVKKRERSMNFSSFYKMWLKNPRSREA